MKLEVRYQITRRVITIALVGVVMVCCSWLMFFYNPLQLIITKVLELAPGTIFFNIWAQPPYDVVMKIYLFNITNSEKFLRGEEKLNVTQVGPYAYKEILTHHNASFNGEDGTLLYEPRRDFVLDRENSAGDAFSDRVLIPNIPLIGIQAYLQDSSFVTNLAFSTLTSTLGTNPILNLTVDEFLWGYEDKLVTIANRFLPNWIDFGKFGLFERLMSRDNTNKIKISLTPGKRKSRFAHLLSQEEMTNMFHIVEWNDSPGLPDWGYSEYEIEKTKRCELIEGSFDGTIFPRPMKRNWNMTMFRKAFCRPIQLEFIGDGSTKQGFKTYDYKLSSKMFASPEENPYNECFCFKGKCPYKGLQTIAPCYYDMPITLSQPHFLNVDPEIRERVIGLNPDPKLHDGIAKYQPELGIPLDESSLKIQVNMEVGETKYNTKTKPFNNLVIPLFWIELTVVELPPLVAFLVTLVTEILPIGQNVLIYLLGLLGLALISGSALLALFFTRGSSNRSLSIVSDYSPIPIISIPSPSQYLKNEIRKADFRISK